MKTQTNTERTELRRNRFSGQPYMLTKAEAKIHDRVFINELKATLENTLSCILDNIE